MSIASAIQLKQQQVAAAYTACDEKGATMPAAGSQNLTNLASTIATISGGGPAPEPIEQGDVTFIDYDGTILYSYTFAEALALQSLPANPSHSGLVAQGWNWTLAEIQACAATEDSVVAGQLYTTDDGKTRIYITISDDIDSYPVQTGWSQTKANGVVVDWGDGSNTETVSGTGVKVASHLYAPGDYTITLEVIDGTATLGGNGFGCVSYVNNSETQRQNILTKIEVGNDITGFNGSYFQYAANLKTISLSQEATSNYPNIFQGCQRLEAFVLPKTSSISGSFARFCRFMSAVSLPPTITVIPSQAFSQNYNLSVIGLGNVVKIDSNAFENCCYMPNTLHSSKLTTIAGSVFTENYSVTSLDFPALVSITGANNLQYTRVEKFILSQNITSYPASFLNYARVIKEWEVHSGVTAIPSSCFSGCHSLRKVLIHADVTSIAASAFNDCLSLEAVILKSSTPPSLANVNALNNASQCPIYIPATSLSSYKTATNWSSFKDRFRPWDYGESEYNATMNTQVLSNLSGGTQYSPIYCVSDYIPLVEGHSYTFSGGVNDSSMHFCIYDSSKNYLNYYNVNANPRTITLSYAGAAYGRLTCRQDWLSRAFIYDDTTDELIWPVKKTS